MTCKKEIFGADIFNSFILGEIGKQITVFQCQQQQLFQNYTSLDTLDRLVILAPRFKKFTKIELYKCTAKHRSTTFTQKRIGHDVVLKLNPKVKPHYMTRRLTVKKE